MNKTKLAKIILVTIIFALVSCTFTSVFAANDDIPSLNPSLNLNPTPGGSTDNTQNPSNKTENNTDTNNNTNTNTNSSSYQESDIPYAGPAETALMVTAFIVFGIIGVYTFNKLSYYSNI